MDKLSKIITNSFRKIRRLSFIMMSSLSPVLSTHLGYRARFHKRLNLKHPKTLNEKVLWLKLNTYRNNALVTQCVDKFKAREYVEACGYGHLLNHLLYTWDTVDKIDWSSLPNSFALKCNHGCGYNIICGDKNAFDESQVKKTLKKWMKEDYWRVFAEVQYKGISKKILCEQHLSKNGHLPSDYKVYCFHGHPRFVLVCEEREKGLPRFYFFDSQWQFLPITRDGQNVGKDFTLNRPKSLQTMLECAATLSAPFPFVRVDFYDVDGKAVFGEMTFTPSAGMDTARLPETDLMFGEMLKL